MKNKVLTVFLASLMMLGFSSCRKSTTTEINISEKSETAELSDEAVVTEAVTEFDDSNLSEEERLYTIAENINIAGTKISLPFRIADLGEDYSLQFGSALEESDKWLFLLYHNEERIGNVMINGYKEGDDPAVRAINNITITSKDADAVFGLKGAGFDTSRSEMSDKTGLTLDVSVASENKERFRIDSNNFFSVVYENDMPVEISVSIKK